ncbi:class IV adenylate cyclase [Caldisalinibacter kiritimatiensis]|uniref:Putative adenylate cyclase n=1 Tax=Caldisalinibacter kiritimatiensis TaxID=1304284 RepID=R1AUN8_9FIRM|nr:class IV adenylate cyclase [Caldisalinibacter kiritimatiensis]EOD00868.1 putative adenylate cyclase [Caldisalinibacter kiritimatiensis]
MKELEVKVLNIDKEEIQERLKSIGAELVKKEYQVNTIFDTEDRIIKNEHKGYLRIREKRDLLNNKTEYIFTLKKNLSSEKVRKNVEIETKVDNKDALTEILKHLKLDIKHSGSKERISYKYDDILFEIDTWDEDTYPYPYLEIEVNKEEDLERAIELLNLNREDVTDKSLDQLRREVGLGGL